MDLLMWVWICPVLQRLWKQEVVAGPCLNHKPKPFLMTVQKGSASLTVVRATAWEQAAARKITDLHKWFGNSSWILGVCEVLLAQPCIGLWAVREPRVSLSQLSSDVQGHGAVRSRSPGVSPLPSPLARGCLSLWTLNSTSTSIPGAIAGMLSTRETETNLILSTDHGNWLFYIS